MPDTDPLDSFFDAGRASLPPPSEDLTARMLADAAALQPKRPRRRWADRLFGGVGLATGLMTATLAGLAVGFAAPGVFETLIFPGGPLELLPDLDLTDWEAAGV